ncbi:MAG: amidohydrolase family protein, partial [Candidatus Korobacteraceae bacterium]
YFEENRKGTIETGKLADLVILTANPMLVDVTTIKDIKVAETIKDGKTVFQRETSAASPSTKESALVGAR